VALLVGCNSGSGATCPTNNTLTYENFGRPFIAPPDLPPARLNMLRTAFDRVMKDPEVIEDARKQKLDIDPRSGAQLQSLVESIYATPRPIVERIGALIK
jgi:tripartite-type tricarboxylate transporter receptor subunit TctC